MTSSPPRTLRVIGFGCGPDQLTAEAVVALRRTDYVLAADKAADDGPGDPLLAVRRRICEDHGVELVAVRDPVRDRDDPADYPGAVRDWHEARAASYGAVVAQRGGDPGFLVWGDPAFYDSTLRIADRLVAEQGLGLEVVPGVSALQLLAARHRIVLHEVGRPLLVTTGRRLLEDAATHDNLVVMLDGGFAAADLSRRGPGGEWQVWWGANLGTASERLVAGALDDVTGLVRRVREEARREAGWVMDTYLLRQRGPRD